MFWRSVCTGNTSIWDLRYQVYTSFRKCGNPLLPQYLKCFKFGISTVYIFICRWNLVNLVNNISLPQSMMVLDSLSHEDFFAEVPWTRSSKVLHSLFIIFFECIKAKSLSICLLHFWYYLAGNKAGSILGDITYQLHSSSWLFWRPIGMRGVDVVRINIALRWIMK